MYWTSTIENSKPIFWLNSITPADISSSGTGLTKAYGVAIRCIKD
jgi:hypothetical protein